MCKWQWAHTGVNCTDTSVLSPRLEHPLSSIPSYLFGALRKRRNSRRRQCLNEKVYRMLFKLFYQCTE